MSEKTIHELFRLVQEHPDFIGGTIFTLEDVPERKRFPDDAGQSIAALSARLGEHGERALNALCIDRETHFIVKRSKASRVYQRQLFRVAVLEVKKGLGPRDIKQISRRARGVHRVVKVWENVPRWSGKRGEYEQVVEEAERMADELNSPMDQLAAVADQWEKADDT